VEGTQGKSIKGKNQAHAKRKGKRPWQESEGGRNIGCFEPVYQQSFIKNKGLAEPHVRKSPRPIGWDVKGKWNKGGGGSQKGRVFS